MTTAPAKKSDLGVRTLSAIVMLAVAGTALWLGGAVLDAFIIAIAVIVVIEFGAILRKIGQPAPIRAAWFLAGFIYVGLAALSLVLMPVELLILALGVVIFTDTGAYFAGRTIGGAKIAPSISPSKTWAGLFGGMAAAAMWTALAMAFVVYAVSGLSGSGRSGEIHLVIATAWKAAAIGAGLAVAAQAGDFFESWLKRKAGVKDSSRLIPGHGGVFDRVDGLLPVAIIVWFAWNWVS